MAKRSSSAKESASLWARYLEENLAPYCNGYPMLSVFPLLSSPYNKAYSLISAEYLKFCLQASTRA